MTVGSSKEQATRDIRTRLEAVGQQVQETHRECKSLLERSSTLASERLDLTDDVRPLLDEIDRGLMALLALRNEMVRHVAVLKQGSDTALQAADREASMLARIRSEAARLSVDQAFASELWSLIIWHSKQEQSRAIDRTDFQPHLPVAKDRLKEDLRALAHEAANRYGSFADPGDAISAHLARERRLIADAIAGLRIQRRRALDLGCADGLMTRELDGKFGDVIGYDISESMLDAAKRSGGWSFRTRFEICDLSQGIPGTDGDVSFCVANFGSASELGPEIVDHIARVLEPGGRALISFYNLDALLLEWFYPWPSTVRARLNRWNDTADVWFADRVFTIEARGLTADQAWSRVRRSGLDVLSVESHPTVQSIIPRFFFDVKPEQREGKGQRGFRSTLVQAAAALDEQLAVTESALGSAQVRRSSLFRGTYLTVLAQKPR